MFFTPSFTLKTNVLGTQFCDSATTHFPNLLFEKIKKLKLRFFKAEIYKNQAEKLQFEYIKSNFSEKFFSFATVTLPLKCPT